ncbi:MAG: enolase C-terminal domain-like protein [Clostridia bacterium]
MKIIKIHLYNYDWINAEPEGFMLSGGRGCTEIPGRVLEIETDEGISGWGDESPWGGQYLEMFVGAVKPGLDLLAPALIGKDPTRIGEINYIMNKTLLGHGYIKALVDMACWDIFGKAMGRPLYDLLGGKLNEKVPVTPFIMRKYGEHQKSILEDFRKAGINQFCTKASGSIAYTIEYIEYISSLLLPGESVVMDVNRGWRLDEALMMSKAVGKAQIYFEQPCDTYEDCRTLMQTTGMPVVLCECIKTPKDLGRAIHEGAIAGLNIKIGRVGGVTQARFLRDMCAEWKIQCWMQCVNVAQIGDAAIAHLAYSTPSEVIRNSVNNGILTSTVIAEGGPQVINNIVTISDRPGLGVTPIRATLGNPIGSWS